MKRGVTKRIFPFHFVFSVDFSYPNTILLVFSSEHNFIGFHPIIKLLVFPTHFSCEYVSVSIKLVYQYFIFHLISYTSQKLTNIYN